MARLSLVLILGIAIIQPAAAATTHHRARRHLATATRVTSASSASSGRSAKASKASKTRTPRGPRWAANDSSNGLDVELKISPPRRDTPPPPPEMGAPSPSAATPSDRKSVV